MSEFKGTKGEWYFDKNTNAIKNKNVQGILATAWSVYNLGLEEVREEGESWLSMRNRTKQLREDKEKETIANAQLISCAPEMFKELNETIVDLNILRNQLLDASKTNHLFDGMPELLDEWIERKNQLIKKATSCV